MACRFSPDAERCLDEIWVYVARESGSLTVADRLVESIIERCQLVGQHPRMGRSRADDLRPGLRSFPVGSYVILYRIEDDDTVILHILHGSRDLPGLLE